MLGGLLTVALLTAGATGSDVDSSAQLPGGEPDESKSILWHKHHKSDESICHRWDWRKKALKVRWLTIPDVQNPSSQQLKSDCSLHSFRFIKPVQSPTLI